MKYFILTLVLFSTANLLEFPIRKISKAPLFNSNDFTGIADYLKTTAGYETKVEIGDQSFDLTLFLLTPGIYVEGKNCENCHSKVRYTGSTTDETWSEGPVSGVVAKNDFNMFGYSLKELPFFVITKLDYDIKRIPVANGILGLSPGLSPNGDKSFIETLKSEGMIKKPVFYFNLKNSKLHIGDTIGVKGLKYYPSLLSYFFFLSVNKLTMGKIDVPVTVLAFVVGSDKIYLPTKLYEAGKEMLEGKDFKNLPSLVFNFGGDIDYPFTPEEYLIKENGKTTLPFEEISRLPDYVMVVGDSFLRAYTVVFDYSHNVRIGIAHN